MITESNLKNILTPVLSEMKKDYDGNALALQTELKKGWVSSGVVSDLESGACNAVAVGTMRIFNEDDIVDDTWTKCDGRIVKISEYSDLANFYTLAFGKCNYYGGDGVTTFQIGSSTEPDNHYIKYKPSSLVSVTLNQSDMPIGVMMQSLLGLPDGFIKCDGTEYPIGTYPQLEQLIIDTYGKVNYWGGDGVNTWAIYNAVPITYTDLITGSDLHEDLTGGWFVPCGYGGTIANIEILDEGVQFNLKPYIGVMYMCVNPFRNVKHKYLIVNYSMQAIYNGGYVGQIAVYPNKNIGWSAASLGSYLVNSPLVMSVGYHTCAINISGLSKSQDLYFALQGNTNPMIVHEVFLSDYDDGEHHSTDSTLYMKASNYRTTQEEAGIYDEPTQKDVQDVIDDILGNV